MLDPMWNTIAGVDIIVTTLPRCGWGVGGAVEPGGSDDGMTITICSFYSFTGTDDSELQAILAKCVKKWIHQPLCNVLSCVQCWCIGPVVQWYMRRQWIHLSCSGTVFGH